ncbi:MAG: glycosyltransferase family 4 protein [Bacteroidota bacterium]
MTGQQRTDPLKVLMVTRDLDAGGVEEVILTYAKAMRPPRFQLSIVCNRPGKVYGEISRLPFVQSYCVATTSRVKRFLGILKVARTVRPDIVHNHTSWYGLFAGTIVGAKRVETIHNTYHWLTHLQKFQYGLYCLLADRIIAVSEVVKQYTLGELPFFRPGKFRVVYNGVQPEAFQPSRQREESLHTDRPAGSVAAVGFIGRLTEQKGVDYLLDAAALLQSRRIDHRLVIVGDGELRDQLETKARSLGLGRVTFTGYQRNIAEILGGFDVFVLPSLWEGFPVSLVEAMASGLPVVATRVGGTGEAVLDGITGYLVTPRDAEDLADKIATLVTDPDTRNRMRLAAQRRVREHFSASTMLKKTEDVYNEILPAR